MKDRSHRRAQRGWVSRNKVTMLASATVLAMAGAGQATGQSNGHLGGLELHTLDADAPLQAVATPRNTAAPKEGSGQGSEDGGTAAASGMLRFAIASGELTDALESFGRTAHVKVKSTIPADKLAGFRTAGVQGELPPAESLHQLLAKTGLEGLFDGGETVEISIQNAERDGGHDVHCADWAAAVFAAAGGYRADGERGAAVHPERAGGHDTARQPAQCAGHLDCGGARVGRRATTLTIRGFSARNDIFLDGIRDFGSYYRDSFNYESVDVLEGPASVEFGRGSTGGVVNQESKVAELHSFTATNVQLGTDALRRGTLDFDRPLPAIPGGTAFRVNVMGEEAGVAGRNVTQTRRYGVAPSLSLGLNTATRASISLLHEREDSIPDYGLPYFGAAVAAVPRTTYYGIDGANYLRTTPDVVTVRVDHDFGLHLTVRNNFRWGNYPRDARITEPQINTTAALPPGQLQPGQPLRVSCAQSATVAQSCYTTGTPLSQVYVRRNQISVLSTEDILWDQLSATARFTVGHVANSAMLLLEGGRERSIPRRPGVTAPYVPALDPTAPGSSVLTPGTNTAATHVQSLSYAVNFLDTLELTRWLQVSGGVRFDHFDTTSTPPSTTPPAQPATRLDEQPTYRAAVIAKPRPAGSVYFDWGTSFNPAAESLSLSANNATAPPEYNETYEVGAKWNFLRDRLNLNGSVFRTEKLNARETNPLNTLETLNTGNQLVRGVQVGALGHMPSAFDLLLGYAFLDGRVESSILNASPFAAINAQLLAVNDPRANTAPFFINPKGFPLANVPRNSGNFWVTHRLIHHVVGGVGGSYVGARRASSTSLIGVYRDANPIDPAAVPLVAKAIPGYALLNAMVQYPVTERISVQANVNNLANKFFIDAPHPNHLIPGERAERAVWLQL